MLSLCGLVACASTACDDKNDPLPPVGPADGPKVTLTAGETTPSTVSFSITPSDAAACAYMMLAEDQPVPSAAVILSDGVEAESKQSTPVTLRGLVPETTYVVVAAVTDGKTSASSEPLRLTTKKVTTPDDAVVLDRVIEAIYYGENLLNASADYYIQLANVACVQDEYGYYQPAGKGTLLSLDLWGAPSPAGNRALPTGTYMLDADNMPLTLDPNFTVLRVSDGSEFAEYDFESGEVIVERDGSTYTISATLTDSNEGVHNFKYTGPLSIADREAPTYDPITHDVNTTFIGADALYYGDRNKTGFGSFEVYLYDVPKKNGFLTRAGYQLVLELTTPLIRKGEDIFIANGTYTVSSQTPALFKFTPGYALPDDPYPYGSVCEQNDEDGAPYYALLNGGTIEINRTGTTYTFTANLETVEGIEIKGTYTGEIPIEDRNGWRPGGGGYSTLHLDVTPDLKGIRTGKLIYLGNYLRLGYSSFILQIVADDQPESIEIEVICENTYTTDIALGHYTVMPGRSEVNMVPWAVMPGFMLESNTSGTWYLERNEDGDVVNGAPANAGTIDISKDGDNYTVAFDLEDDCTEPNRISGSWTGTMEFVSSPFSLKPGTLFRPQSNNEIPQRQGRSGHHAR